MNNFNKNNAIASYTNLFITILSALILVPIIESSVGKNYYGIYQFVYSLAVYTELMGLGLGKTVERYVARYDQQKSSEKESTTVSIALSIYMVTGLCYLTGAAVLYWQFGRIFNFSVDEIAIARLCFLIASLNAVINIPASLFFYHLRGRGKFVFLFNLGTVKALLRIAAITAVLRYGQGLVALFIVEFFLVQSINLVYAVTSIYKYGLRVRLFYFERKLFRDLLNYTWYVFLIGVAGLFFWNTDNIILGILTDAETIAEYALSQRLLQYFFMYSIAFSGLFLPLFMENYIVKDQDLVRAKMIDLFTYSSRLMAILMSFAVVNFIVLGLDFIELWLGHRYQMTYYYTLIILIPYWLLLSQTTGEEMLYVMKKHKVRTYVTLSSALVNIILTFWFVRIGGAVGAAVATSLTLSLGIILGQNLYYRYLLKMNLAGYLREVFLKNVFISGAALLYGFALNRILSGITAGDFLLKGLIFNLVFVPLLLVFLTTGEERQAILERGHKVKVKIRRGLTGRTGRSEAMIQGGEEDVGKFSSGQTIDL